MDAATASAATSQAAPPSGRAKAALPQDAAGVLPASGDVEPIDKPHIVLVAYSDRCPQAASKVEEDLDAWIDCDDFGRQPSGDVRVRKCTGMNGNVLLQTTEHAAFHRTLRRARNEAHGWHGTVPASKKQALRLGFRCGKGKHWSIAMQVLTASCLKRDGFKVYAQDMHCHPCGCPHMCRRAERMQRRCFRQSFACTHNGHARLPTDRIRTV